MIRNLFLILILLTLNNCKRATSYSNDEKRSEPIRTYSRDKQSSKSNIVKMVPSGGVYYVPIEINSVAMKIIFDTGASSISISETEVLFLWKQGKINGDDILGAVRFQDATGNISEGTRINLKEVKIGNRTINNVEASVVHNLEAPLLLGQSALSKFGKVTIDYKKNEISFE